MTEHCFGKHSLSSGKEKTPDDLFMEHHSVGVVSTFKKHATFYCLGGCSVLCTIQMCMKRAAEAKMCLLRFKLLSVTLSVIFLS